MNEKTSIRKREEKLKEEKKRKEKKRKRRKKRKERKRKEKISIFYICITLSQYTFGFYLEIIFYDCECKLQRNMTSMNSKVVN